MSLANPQNPPEFGICYRLRSDVRLGGAKSDIAHKKKLRKYVMRRDLRVNIVAISSIILRKRFPVAHAEILVFELFWPKSRFQSRCVGWGVQTRHRPQEKSVRDRILTRYRTENNKNHRDYPAQTKKTHFLDFPIVAALSL